MTSLPKKVIEENIYSIYGIPIVGEWIYKLDGTDEKTWGSHGGRIILDDKGIHFEQTTKPFGFVSKEAADNVSWVTITEKDGHTKNEYLKLSGCILWTDRYEESKTILDDNYGQSMEIEFKKGHYRDDHYYEAEEFIFSALCILGTDCEPCFESACIGRHYELDSFKKEFSLMLDEYKKLTNKPNKEERQFMDLEKLKSFLSTFTVGEGEKATEQYALIGATENSFTVMDKNDNLKIYTVEFALDDDGNIAADWDGKVEKKFSVVDFETENAVSIREVIDFETIVNKHVDEKALALTDEFTKAFNKEVESKDNAYAELNSKYTSAMAKLAEYESAEKEAERISHKNEIDKIISDFAKKIGRSPKFLVYKAKLNADEVTTEQVMQDLTLMVGQEMVNKSTNFSYQPQEVNVGKANDDEITNRYGHLLDKFRK